MGCPSDPVMPDAGRSDAGADAPVVPFDAGPEMEVAGGSVMGSWCGAVHVTANATVDAGQTLTICAGSVVRFDADQFKASDVVNLLQRAGAQVGIGEGRPFSKSSNGLGYGTFDVEVSG
jgi:hypothetical protein